MRSKLKLLTWCLFVSSLTLAHAKCESSPPTEPILRIETNTHNAPIKRIAVDSSCHLIATASDDKTTRLWQVPETLSGEPILLRVFRAPIGLTADAGAMYAVALSGDDRFIAAGGWDSDSDTTTDNAIYIFDTQNGNLIRRLGGHTKGITHLTFSSDGKYLAATLNWGAGVRIFATNKWDLVREDNDYKGAGTFGAAFDSANNLYTVSFDGFVRRYDANFRLEAKQRVSSGARPYSIAVHPRNDRIAIGFDDTSTVDIYDAKTLTLLRATQDSNDAEDGSLHAVTWSTDGAHLYAAGRHGSSGLKQMISWDQFGRNIEWALPVSKDTIMELLPCGDFVAVGSQEPAFGLVSSSGGKAVWEETRKLDMRDKLGNRFELSPTGDRVRFSLNGRDEFAVFDIVDGRLANRAKSDIDMKAAETTSLEVVNWENNSQPQLNGRFLRMLPLEVSRSLAIAPDKHVLVLGTDWALRAYNDRGVQLWWKSVPGPAWGVNISANGKFVVAAYGDGTIRWHRLEDGQEIVALFVLPTSREWILWTPEGYYSSSVSGDRYIGWHLNNGWQNAADFVVAAQLEHHLYRPDIVKRTFELADSRKAVDEVGLKGFRLLDLISHKPPGLKILAPQDRSHVDRSPLQIQFEVQSATDPVTGIEVRLNGRQLTPPLVNRGINRIASVVEKEIVGIPLESGENNIFLSARNVVGETQTHLLVYMDGNGVQDRKGRLFILAIGVNKYQKLDMRYNLRYAVADAQLITDTLRERSGSLYSEVKIKLLTSDSETPPTRANIEDALLFFRDSRPEDTVVLFVSGHGVNQGADYLMVPEDGELSGDVWRPSSVVKWSVFQEALQDALGTRILLIDTCHSSGAYNSRLVKDAADANIVVFSATDKDTAALETSDLGHGVFTYALDKGLRGAADSRKIGAINILALGDYVSDEVKRITNGEQEPVFRTSGVKNFAVTTP